MPKILRPARIVGQLKRVIHSVGRTGKIISRHFSMKRNLDDALFHVYEYELKNSEHTFDDAQVVFQKSKKVLSKWYYSETLLRIKLTVYEDGRLAAEDYATLNHQSKLRDAFIQVPAALEDFSRSKSMPYKDGTVTGYSFSLRKAKAYKPRKKRGKNVKRKTPRKK